MNLILTFLLFHLSSLCRNDKKKKKEKKIYAIT